MFFVCLFWVSHKNTITLIMQYNVTHKQNTLPLESSPGVSKHSATCHCCDCTTRMENGIWQTGQKPPDSASLCWTSLDVSCSTSREFETCPWSDGVCWCDLTLVRQPSLFWSKSARASALFVFRADDLRNTLLTSKIVLGLFYTSVLNTLAISYK